MATMTLPCEDQVRELETNNAVDKALIEAVERIGPVIAAYRDEAERERRLSKPVLDAMIEVGLFRMLVPRSLGGLEVAPLTYARVVEAVSQYDSTAGWALCNPGAFAHGCLRLPDQGAEEIFGSDKEGIISAAINPPIKAVPVEADTRSRGERLSSAIAMKRAGTAWPLPSWMAASVG